MGFIAIDGAPRTGKTLMLTKLGHENYSISKHQVFANYQVTYATPVTIQRMLTMPFENVDRDYKTLLIQEADKIFDRTKPSSHVNRLLRSLTGQSGKRNLDIYYDTQYLHRVATELTDYTEMVIECSSYVDSKTKESLCFEYQFCKFDGERITQILSTKKYPVVLMRYPVDYFKLYDTYAPTMPIWDYQLTKGEINEEIDRIQSEQEEALEKKIKKKEVIKEPKGLNIEEGMIIGDSDT